MEDVEIKQTRGPTLRFRGELIAEDNWDSRGGLMRIEIWQTEAGALIPVSEGPLPHGRPDERDVRAEVVRSAPPNALIVTRDSDGTITAAKPWRGPLGEMDNEEEQAMRFAVMDFFDWENRARSMVRKQLKWRLVREVA